MKEIGRRASAPSKRRMGKQVLFLGAAFFVCLFGLRYALGDDTLNVKKDSEKMVYTVGAGDEKNTVLSTHGDKEKNIYSIGSSKQKKEDEARKQEKSWDMLMNMEVWQGNHDFKDSPERQSSTGPSPNVRPSQGNPVKGQTPQRQPLPAQ